MVGNIMQNSMPGSGLVGRARATEARRVPANGLQRHAHHTRHLCCSASLNGPSSGSSSGERGGSKRSAQHIRAKRARAPGLFEVRVVTPPPRSLGIFALPPLTHNGEEIEVDGQGFVVTSVVVQMKLNKGKYVRDHSRLDVQPTGRYFLNLSLDNLLRAKYVGPTGPQD